MLILDFVCFSIDLYAFMKWWTANPEWRKFSLINNTRCLVTVIDDANGMSVYVFCPVDSPLLVQQFSDSMLVLESSSTHVYVSLVCPQNIVFFCSP